MHLTLETARTTDDLAAQCNAATTTHLARLMLHTFAVLGAAHSWDHLPELAEDLARDAARLGLPIADQDPETLAHWEQIAETPPGPPAPRPGSGTPAVVLAAEQLAERFSEDLLAAEIAGQLNCPEADALVDLLTATGAARAAHLWSTAHAAHDREEDALHAPSRPASRSPAI